MAKKRPAHLQKKRFQISLSPTAARMMKELALIERRTWSNTLEVLIERAATAQPQTNTEASV
jgi:methionyl-tRNA formyltransferase